MAAVTIMAIKLSKRRNEAVPVQETLTKYGCLIKMRLGIHEAGDACSEEGIILLQLTGSKKEINGFTGELKKKCKVQVKVMEV